MMGSRPSSPPVGTPLAKDEDKQAFLMNQLGAAAREGKERDSTPISTRDQGAKSLIYEECQLIQNRDFDENAAELR